MTVPLVPVATKVLLYVAYTVLVSYGSLTASCQSFD